MHSYSLKPHLLWSGTAPLEGEQEVLRVAQQCTGPVVKLAPGYDTRAVAPRGRPMDTSPMPASDRRLITASERRLLTVLFTDIVGSTDLAVEMGDARWRELIARHHALVRGELKRFGGREIDTAGDGFFATFDRPAQAIRCAAAVAQAVRGLGIEVRAGLHLGEVEVGAKNVGGVAVHTGARVLAAADPGEVLVTATLRELVSGSGLEFADRGQHTLKGVPGTWQLYGLEAVDGRPLEPGPDPPTAAERRAAIATPTLLRRSRVPAAIAAAAVVLLIIALVLRDHGSQPPKDIAGPKEPPLNAVVNVDPTSGNILHITPNALERHGGGNPKIAVGEGGVWIHSAFLEHLDLRTGAVIADRVGVETNGNPGADPGIEFGDRAVWIGGGLQGDHAVLLRWDPATDEQLPDISLRADVLPNDVAVGKGAVWVTFPDGKLVELNPDTRRVVARTAVGGFIDEAVLGAGGLWVLDITEGTLTRVDPRTLATSDPTGFSGSVLGMAADDEHVWLLETSGNDVIPVSADGVVGDPIPVGENPSGIAVGLGAVWVCDEGGDVYMIDPLTSTTRKIEVGGHLTAIAVDEGAGTLWLTVGGD
jgi:class 3 adenylate cyclase